jgi:hypothetical protein
MIYSLIKKGLLNEEDRQYLKADHTVLKKNGGMKKCILENPLQNLLARFKKVVNKDKRYGR